MNSFIKKMNTLPLFHPSKEPFLHKPFLANLFETFHATYLSLHLDSITYKIEKDRPQGLLKLEKNLKNAPNEIKEWCKKHYLYEMVASYTIKGQRVHISFSLFSGHESMMQTYVSYIPWILHWFSLAYQFSEKKCLYPVHLYLYLTPFKKLLPEQGTILEEIHVNTAYTWSCKPNNKIILFRHEEWFKVLIHESFHFFNFEEFDANHEIQLKKCFPLSVSLYVGEAYGEFWARVLNCFYCAYFIDKEFSRKITTLNHFYRFVYMESMFSCYQLVKVLNHNNIHYEDFYSESKESLKRRKMYKEKTNVFCYYIVTTVLMNEFPMVMSWCNSHNKQLFNIELKHSHLLVELIKRICKTSNLQHNLTVLGDIHMHDKTLRMSLIDFL
jgi:hypothetical protein